MFTLWRERASKEEREYLKAELERVLYTLVNPTRKHSEDGNHHVLRSRIRSTLKELSILTAELKHQGYREAAEFITQNAKLLVNIRRTSLRRRTHPPHHQPNRTINGRDSETLQTSLGSLERSRTQEYSNPHPNPLHKPNPIRRILAKLYPPEPDQYITTHNADLAHDWTAPIIFVGESLRKLTKPKYAAFGNHAT